jgi:hypothetical protein
MPLKRKEDQKLKDVRAALRSLQRIDLESSPHIELRRPEPAARKNPAQSKRLGALALAMIAMGTVIVLAIDLLFKYWPAATPGGPATETVGKATPPAAGNAGAGLSIAGLPSKTGQPAKPPAAAESGAAPPANTTPADPRITQAVDNARQLMEAGQIVAARKMLLQPALAASQDAAWLIARSFDPNYLAMIQSADAAADKAQAEEWYRRWRDIGARNGAGMDDARLKRLIDAMK